MALFLTVLKIIGIVLLCILALILLILLLVLFVPIRYKVDGNVPRTGLDDGFDAENICVRASFSWLLFVLRGGIVYPEKKQFEVRVFGIKVFPLKAKIETDDEGKTGIIEMSNMGESDDAPVCENGAEDEHSEKENSSQEHDADKNFEETEKSFLDVLWDIIDNISNILKTPQNVFEKIQYTISRVCGKISMIKNTIENDIFKRAFDLVKRMLIKIIKMILPDKCDIDLCLGTGDPADTAELVAFYSAFYPLLYKKVRYEPDFEEKVIGLDAHIKGHITVFTIVYGAAVCFFNKDVKKVIRRFKKILKS